jgi:stage IV sporulation protein FB
LPAVVSGPMQDPFAWSIPFGRLFGITIRIHILFPFVALAMIARAAFRENAVPGDWIDASVVIGLLFLSVLLHEFGHCFMARGVGGDAQEVLLWPLGGLANCEVPHTPRANFLVAFAGPLVNLVLALVCMLLLWLCFTPSLQPWFWLKYPGRDGTGLVTLLTWAGEKESFSALSFPVLLTYFFWVNYISFLLNMVLVGFPMDAGRMFQSVLWKYVGYRRGTLAAVYAGFVTMFIIGLYSIVVKDPLFLCLALFIYVSCRQQWLILERGGEDNLFGYDFSQGYTSLERDDPPPQPKPKQSWWQRWRQRRAERKAKLESDRREADESRLDELLDKVARQGIESLTDEERRFMQRVSDRYRNRNRG